MELTVDQALQQAAEACKSGKLLDAERLYRAILQAEPKHPDANHNIGVLAVSAGEPGAALPFLKTALEAKPEQRQFWISFIDALVKANQLDAARQVLQQGKLAGLAGDAIHALELQLQSKATPPEDERNAARDELSPAIALRESGKYREAQEWLNTLLSSRPNDGEAWSLLSQVYLLDKKEGEAEKSIAKAKALKPESPSVHRNQARLLLRQARPAEALKAAQSAYEKSVDDPESCLVLAGCLRANQRNQEALVLLEKALAGQPNYAEALTNRALILLEAKDVVGALTDAEAALSIKPHLTQLWGLVGSLRYQNKNLAGAIDALKNAYRSEPANVNLMVNLGDYLRQDNKLDEAIFILESAVRQHPQNSAAWANLGTAWQQAGKIADAKSAYQNALAINPESAEISSNLGALAKDSGDWESALVYLDQALAINPKFAQVLSNKGLVLEKLGRFEDAKAAYLLALELEPDLPAALYNLANHYYYSDESSKAISLYQKVIVADPSREGLHAALKLSVLYYASGDLQSFQSQHSAAAAILQRPDKKYKNDRIYWRYLQSLMVWRQQHASMLFASDGNEVLYVIGESHSLSAAGISGGAQGKSIKFVTEWIEGCKQWHLGNAINNKYKKKFEAVIARLSRGSTVLLTIGEIDCRHDEGILKHSRKHPETPRHQLVESTIKDYLNYVAGITLPFEHKVTIQGVPCPNISAEKLSSSELSELIELIKVFNSLLMSQAHCLGFDFLDTHALTDRGDGFSNEVWHIDQYHLSPAGIAEAWSKYCRRANKPALVAKVEDGYAGWKGSPN